MNELQKGLSIEFFEVATSSSRKSPPKWKRSFGVSESGTVFVPAAIAGDEASVFECAVYDGQPVVRYLERAFVSADWMSQEYPSTKTICDLIKLKAVEAQMEEHGNG